TSVSVVTSRGSESIASSPHRSGWKVPSGSLKEIIMPSAQAYPRRYAPSYCIVVHESVKGSPEFTTLFSGVTSIVLTLERRLIPSAMPARELKALGAFATIAMISQIMSATVTQNPSIARILVSIDLLASPIVEEIVQPPFIL